jgi:hypothetical protein
MVAAPNPAGYRYPSRNSGQLLESRWNRLSATPRLGTASASKTGQRGDHRLWRRVDQRPGCGAWTAARSQSLGQACEPYRDAIELGLSRGRNAMAIWQELVDTCGLAASYQSVQRFVRKLHPSRSPEACAVIETAPGEEAQVDYGTGPMVQSFA